jgi:antitoxin CptB
MNKLEILKKKIKYRASYRGTKEMDILLTTFIASAIENLEYGDLLKLDVFLSCNDEEIYNFYMSGSDIPSFSDKKILSLFKSFKI